jgi:hypothetical protein
MSQAKSADTTLPAAAVPTGGGSSRRALLTAAPAVAAAALAIGGIANAVAIAMSKAPVSPDDPDAKLIELAFQIFDLAPDVDASAVAVQRSDARANRATMVRLGMDPDAPGAKGWASKETEPSEFEKRAAVWRQVREELGTDLISDAHEQIQTRSDQLFEEMLTLPITTLRGAALVGVCAIVTGAISHFWQEDIDELDWPDRVIRLLIENLHVGATGQSPAIFEKLVRA